MITKGRGPDQVLALGSLADPALASWYKLMRLKRLYRQGWLRRGIPAEEAESVADHSFGAAVLALLLAGEAGTGGPAGLTEGADPAKVVLLALVHELGEAFAGDLTPADAVPAAEKKRLENESFERALEGVGETAWIRLLWEEYELGASREARFARELDRLEMGLQAALHHAEGRNGMEEFFTSARKAVSEPRLRAMLEAAVGVAAAPGLAQGPGGDNA